MGAHDAIPVSGTPAYNLAKFGNGLSGGSLAIGGAITASAGTVELWVKSSTSGAIQVAFGHATSGIWIGQDAAGKAAFGRPGLAVSSTISIADGVFHHLALTITGTVYTLWVDGVSGATSSHTSGLNLPSGTEIGRFSDGSKAWAGQIDEVRISSVVRYSSAFTSPTGVFIVDGDTVSLFHLDSSGVDSVPDVTPPSVPTALATTAGPGTLLLSWTASTDSSGAPGYEVYRGTSSPVALTTPVGVTAAGVTQYLDSNVSNPNVYYYAVKAVDSSGNKSSGSAEASGTPAVGTTAVFLPNDSKIVYSPANWDVTSVRAKTINPGAYVRASIAGGASKIVLTFDMGGNVAPYPILKYRLDDGPFRSVVLAASITLELPTTNSWTEHALEFVVQSTSEFVNRWSVQAAHVSLTSIVVTGATATTLSTVTRAARNILVFGDSIVEAYKSLLNVTTPDGSDATVGWAYLLGQLLGAEVGVIGFGGQGWTVSGQGGVPKLASSYALQWGSGPARSFSAVVPDLIVISLGHNDGIDTAAVTGEAVTVITALLAATPIRTQIVVLQPFSGRQSTRLQAAVTTLASKRVRYVDTTGWFVTSDALDGTHPTGFASKRSLAPKSAAAIRAAVDRRHYVNVGGSALPVNPVLL